MNLELKVVLWLGAWFFGWLFVATTDQVRDALPLIAWLILMGLTIIPAEKTYRELRAKKYDHESD